MINRSSLSDSAQIRLMEIIADLRSRWRMKVALRGLAIVAAAGVFALLISAVGLERFGFTPAAVVAFRVLTYLTIVALAVQYLFRPLMRKVTDDTIALYLEEHEPSLEATVLSALSVGDPEKNTHISRALALRTIEDAVARCHAIDDGRRIDQRAIARFSTALGGAAILGAGVIFLSPGFLRHGARAILNPFGSVASANPYSIEVDPGNVTIPRGADQPITAALHGFDATQADIVMQRGGDSLFTRLPMNVTDSARFDLLLFALDRDTEYYIESNGIRSQVYRITVADIPYVDGLTLEYHFPAYTGLSPQVIENGGDIAVLRGTTVRVFASTTLPVPGGRIVRENGDTIRMTVDSTGALVGDMKVDANGFYHIELEGPNVQPSSSSPQYTIEVLDDLPPIVRFTKPGRDTRASAVEEVFVEATAEDDYGVSKLEILYSVNGGEEQSITLMDSNRSLKEAIAGHTFYLEELDLQPGDLVSYYARATDNNAAGQRKSASSDIYFMTIRPFNLDYTQADQAGGGGGGGGGGGQQQNGELSDQQREIVAATFNVLRDSASITTKELEENLVTIALAQEDLEAQAQTLAERMNNRGITNDSSFNAIAELLPQAAEHMDAATAALRDGRPTDALPEEQKALQFLLRAEAIYEEVQIQFQQQQQGGGGGGGGGNSPNAEDLADLFELELDKLRNQYETVQRGEQQQQQGAQSDQVDETLERLRELARRQQQENERMRQLSRAGGSTGGQSSQRDLAQETEEAARQLERLAREQQRPELQDAARRLREAADAMRRSAANARSGNTADGQNALDELEEATRRLQRNQQQALSEQARSALERANQMAREQDDIGERMDQLGNMSGSERAEAARRLVEEKEQQDAEINELQRDLSQMASAANRENPQAARELREAANSIIENRVSEKIRYSRVQTTPGTNREYARALEEEIGANIDEVRQGISDAVDSFEQSARGDQAEESLEEARNLARSLESLEERTRAAQEGDQRRLGQQGEGQQGQQSQQGQQGDQQGQQGQGQQGQQGQGQQGQQGQGQQGQQGQGQQGQQGQGQQGQQGQGQQGQQGQGQQGQQGQGQQGGQQQGQGQQGQGQGQRQGGQQQEGGTGGEQQEGGVTRGMPNGPGGAADNRPPRGLSSDQIRQFRGEARQRLDEARQLREELAREGFDVSDLDQVIMDLSRLDDERVYGTPKELALLQAAIVDGVKQFEYRLRRELAGSAEDRLLLGGSREVPEGFRELVEEYYKTLSRREGGR